MKPIAIFAFSLITLLYACSSEDDVISSENVSTGRMYATFQVIADGTDQVYAEAQLTLDVPPDDSDDSETFIRLENGDRLWLSAGESVDDVDFGGDVFGGFENISESHTRFEEIRRPRDEYFFLFERVIINEFGTFYSAQLPLSEDREYRVSFLRDEDISAKQSVVTVPENFSLLSPSSGSRYSRSSDDIVIEWTNTDPDVSVQMDINITCQEDDFVSYSASLENDTGSFTIFAGELDTEELSGVCSATLNLRKVNVGQFDPSFVGGAVNAYQIRRVVFLSEN